MKSVEFIEALAEVMEVERTELATVDRALAKAGLRQIARGKFRPDITLMEGLQIAFAWAGALKLTQAAEEIERLKRLKVTDPEPETRSSEAYVLAFGGKRADLVGKDFLEMAAIVACRLGQGLFEAHHIEVEIAKQGDVVIRYKSGRERTWLVFFYFGKARLFSPRPVRVTVDISGKVLKWIYDVTEGA